ncbi:hypothetical protein HYC85_028494 [Camellia sinensis]|uniref:Uncharacterized protein n=1 Tax=Camellia sinensis TaxID=4442 RepID=A0A7J7FVB6_CAMSI|nr:hypothetical protein HYC85_028494 [Camellia sinensis]
MFEAFMAEKTFLVEKTVVTDHSKDEVPESSMEDVSGVTEQGGQKEKQTQPAIQFGSVSVNMVHILPHEF